MDIPDSPSKPPPSKRKRGNPEKKPKICILHYKDTTDETFTYFANLKDPDQCFNCIKEICSLRQSQSAGSTLRMDEE